MKRSRYNTKKNTTRITALLLALLIALSSPQVAMAVDSLPADPQEMALPAEVSSDDAPGDPGVDPNAPLVTEGSEQDPGETLPEEAAGSDVPLDAGEGQEPAPGDALPGDVVPGEGEGTATGEPTEEVPADSTAPAEPVEEIPQNTLESAPAFFREAEADGAVISVSAPEGVFPADATLHVEKVAVVEPAKALTPGDIPGAGATYTEAAVTEGSLPATELEKIDEAVREARGHEAKVAISYTFDIQIRDNEGNEIQPADASVVKVSFSMKEVENENLEMQAYHISETGEAQTVEAAEVPAETPEQAPEQPAAEEQTTSEEPATSNEPPVSEGPIPSEETAGDPSAAQPEVPSAGGEAPQTEAPGYQAQLLETTTEGGTATVETTGFSLYTVEFTYNALQYVMQGDTRIPLADILSAVGLTGAPTAVEVSDDMLFSASESDGAWVITSHKPFASEEWMKVTIDGITYEIVVTDDNPTQGCGSAYEQATEAATIDLNYNILSAAPSNIQINGVNANTSGTNNGNFQNDSGTIRLRQGSSTNPSTDYGPWMQILGNGYYNYAGQTITLRYANAAKLSDGTTKDVVVEVSDISIYVPSGLAINGNNINRKSTVFDFSAGPAVRANMLVSTTDGNNYYYGLTETVRIYVDGAPAGETFAFTAEGIDGAGSSSIYQASTYGNFDEAISNVSGGTAYATGDASTLVYLADAAGGITFTATSAGSKDVSNTMPLMQEGAPGDTYDYTASSGPDGSISPSGTTSVPEADPMTYTLTAGKIGRKNTVIDTLKINGVEVDPASVLTPSAAADADGSPNYYTYTFPPCLQADQTIEVTWKAAPPRPPITYPECDDCKNPDPCNDCYNGLNGNSMNGYEKEQSGAYRGGNAASAVTYPSNVNNQLDTENTFANALPYGNTYIDTSLLEWTPANSANFEIDIQDPRFKWVGVSGQTLSDRNGKQPDITLTGGNASSPTIAYYGPVHSYLMYGSEKADGALSFQARTNVTASTDNIASGVYTTSDGGSVTLQNGTMVITPTGGNEYLYKVTYKNAVILSDGSRGDLVLKTTKVELETSYTSDKKVYVGLQKANEMCVNASYDDPNGGRYIPNNEDGAQAQDGNPRVTGANARNAMGEKVTFKVEVYRDDGTPAEGSIAYGAKDLDIVSWQSVWGRQPTDTYASNGGTDPAIINDPVKNAWTGTHEFYEYGEGMAVNSGALSYALVPGYDHDRGNYNQELTGSGQLPINRLLYYQKTLDGLYGDRALEDIIYISPVQALPTTSSTDATANGLKFVTTTTMKFRNSDGIFSSQALPGNGTDNYYRERVENGIRDKYSTGRADLKTYDTGFAVLLNAAGSELTWQGSYHVNSVINTDLFDSDFATYLTQSHGTGGGLQLEAYYVEDGCEPTYIEGTAVMGADSTATVTAIPEDGHRVKYLYISDGTTKIKIEVNEEEDKITIDGTDYALPANGATAEITDNRIVGKNNQALKYKISRDDKGRYDITLSNIKPGLDIHADFETDYYFQKVWEGGVAAEKYPDTRIPDTLYLTAYPYVASWDEVTIGGQKYQAASTIASGAVQRTLTEVLSDGTAGTSYVVVDNPADLNTQHADDHPAKRYPKVEIGGTWYVIMENDVYAATSEQRLVDGVMKDVITGIVDPTTPTATLSVKYERYKDDAYIHKTDFTVNKADIGSKYIKEETNNQTGDITWKIMYPDEGVTALGWAALPLEPWDNSQNPLYQTGAENHELPETHVERIYWFASEDIEKLNLHLLPNAKWIMKSYENDYDNGAAETPGVVTYTQNYAGKTIWHGLSTMDHDDLDTSENKEMMENIELALMSPLSTNVNKKSGQGTFAGWGGKITNRVVETKLRAYKQWVGDTGREELREDLKLTIKREYNYAQKTIGEAGGKKIITFPTGSEMNVLMDTLAGGKTNVKSFKRAEEPLLVNKTDAVDITNNTSLAQYGRHAKLVNGTGDSEATMYLWYDATDEAICYWTDANKDFIFLNADSANMFRGFVNLKDIAGLYFVNATQATTMTGMFSGGGALESLDYLRNWDVRNVTDFTDMFNGQTQLKNINGIIDWNPAAAGVDTSKYTDMFKDVDSSLRVQNPTEANPAKVPFVYYPHLYITGAGDVDFAGNNQTTASDVSNNLIYDVDAPVGRDKVGALKGVVGEVAADTDPVIDTQPARAQYTKWHWDLDQLLLVSDEKKWKYSIYEDEMDMYYSLDGAVGESNAVLMQRNPQSGYLEYTFSNQLVQADLTIAKKVTGTMGSRDQYFKFTIELEDAGNGNTLQILRQQHDLVTSQNAATKETYYALTDGKTAMNIANNRDDNEDTNHADGYQVITGGFDATKHVWEDPSDGSKYQYIDATEDERYTQKEYDDYVATYGTAPPWNVNDIKTPSIPAHWGKFDAQGAEDTTWNPTHDPSKEPPGTTVAQISEYENTGINLRYEQVADLPENTSGNEGKATFTVYLQHGEQMILKGLPRDAKWSIEEDLAEGYKTTVNDGTGKRVAKALTVNGVVTETVERDDANGTFLKLAGQDKYEDPVSYYVGYAGDFNTLKRYSKDNDGAFVEDATGTYYRVVDQAVDAADGIRDGVAYVNIAPSARYESLTKKYRIHVTREFVNKNGAAVPTEVRFSWIAGFLGPIMMVLVAVRFYRRRRKKLALRAAAGGFVHYDAYEDETDEDGFYSVRLFETDAQSADILDPAEFYIVEFAPDDDLAETIDSVQDVAADIDAGEDDFEIEEWL